MSLNLLPHPWPLTLTAYSQRSQEVIMCICWNNVRSVLLTLLQWTLCVKLRIIFGFVLFKNVNPQIPRPLFCSDTKPYEPPSPFLISTILISNGHI